VKYFFYTTLLVASIGTVAAITNPSLVQQGAVLIGLENPQNSDTSTDSASGEDQLSKFLAQYPSAKNKNDDVLPVMDAPKNVTSEFAPPPIPPFPVPATPQPFTEPFTPAYTNSWDAPTWDGPTAVPIQPESIQLTPIETEPNHLPPVAESSFVPDWSGPSQPVQALAPVPQQSIYTVAPAGDGLPVANNNSDFMQTSYVAPVMPPLPQQQTLQQQFYQQQTPFQQVQHYQPPNVQIEEVPVHGTEMVARVGTQVILMGDILPKLRRVAMQTIAENIKKMSDEERAKISPKEIEEFINMFAAEYYPQFLDEQILFALVYSDYDAVQGVAEKNHINEKMAEEFHRMEVPEMMKELNVENIAALRIYLEQNLGSSLEKERRLWIREQIARQWIGNSIQRVTGDATTSEMFEFYEKNQAAFTSPARARWQELVVLFSKHPTEQEAMSKIVWMGNQATRGVSFEEIARVDSDGFTASDGGVWDWTTKGSLTSSALEQAVFSQPIGQLSPAVIKSDRGFHIVKVLEREETRVEPFVEAQAKIRERIREQRGQRSQQEYFTELRRRFPTVIVKNRIDFNVSAMR